MTDTWHKATEYRLHILSYADQNQGLSAEKNILSISGEQGGEKCSANLLRMSSVWLICLDPLVGEEEEIWTRQVNSLRAKTPSFITLLCCMPFYSTPVSLDWTLSQTWQLSPQPILVSPCGRTKNNKVVEITNSQIHSLIQTRLIEMCQTRHRTSCHCDCFETHSWCIIACVTHQDMLKSIC